MPTFFISDLHLTPEQPEITQCFFDFIENEAKTADALYILGDLFEVWIGDDENAPLHQSVSQKLAALNAHSVPIYFIHGNRDFMIGKRFAKAAKMTLLPELHVIDLYGKPTLILHGDTLCLQDIEYQKYRKKIQHPFVIRLLNALPLSFRQALGHKINQKSHDEKKQKSLDIMDVDFDEVIRVMQQYHVTQMIHGHTHRPAVHQLDINGNEARRIVLGDWYTQGSVLVCDETGCRLEMRKFQ